ncbi:unnamed protein product [Mytilus coruscus]|uniref:Uncharacterized protein n=1 Tax=Mytilus coruscus TaxID=42192 RepID=A0A6J8D644_MYTCO|nr:unnamed protein product [Mytilus coruscus]
MGNSMNITNTSDTTIKVLVAPDPAWKISDIFVGAYSFTVGKYDEIHTLKDLWTVWNNIIGLKDFENRYDMVSHVKSLFDKYGIQVGQGKLCKMYDSEVLNVVDSIKPEAWSAMKDTLEVAVAVFVDDCNGNSKLVYYQSASNLSWKVYNKYITRIIHGTMWEDGTNYHDLKA